MSPRSSETKPRYYLANVHRMHVVSVCLHYGSIIWLPWQLPVTNLKIRYRSIVCTLSAFIRWKDCKNRSSVSRDIRLNTPVFWVSYGVDRVHLWTLGTSRTWRSQMSSVNSGVTGLNVTKFSHHIEASFALLTRTSIPWYCHSFSSTSATNASCISRRW